MPRFCHAVLAVVLFALPLAAQVGVETAPREAAQQAPALRPLAAEAAPVASPQPPKFDLTPLGMYHAAHPVVQLVMVALAFATLLCWTVLVYKAVEIAVVRTRTRRSCRTLLAAGSLEQAAAALTEARDPAARMARAAWDEVQRSVPVLDAAGPLGLKERVGSLSGQLDAQATASLRRGTGLLATIGATAPFVGLFGTVWGIMNAFVGISASGTTNLAVVAPGIAEALLATATGLVAAIPAVVIYNHFSRSISGYRLLLGDAAAAIERLVSRDLDFRTAGKG